MALYVDIEKKLGNFHLQVKFEADREMLAILGASGCGKSMTLKCIAGIETPDRGTILLDDTVLFDSEKKINVKPQQRMVGYLFQQYALFPNMTAIENIMCGVRKGSKAEKRQRAEAIIDRLHLTGCEEKKPSMLSGGQQQRCALARILVNEPRVLLLDEPFSALDAHLRFHTERQVDRILKEFGKTTIFVSHDRDEVFRLTDNIAVMENGHFHVMGEKHEIFHEPETIEAAILTGCKNISRAEKLAPERLCASDWGIELWTREISEDLRGIGIRMHDIKIEDPQISGKKSEDEKVGSDPGISEGGNESGVFKSRENIFRCHVIGEIENPFSYSVMLRPEQTLGDKYILIDLPKARWNSIRKDMLTIRIPIDSILLLR